MELRKVKRFIELAEDAGLAELEVRSGRGSGAERVDEHVRIVRVASSTAAAPMVTDASTPAAEPQPVEGGPDTAGQVVGAPMSGTFYRAPAPGEQPFVEAGDTVTVGDVLCIVESMKMMNRIESEYAGQVSAVLIADGVPIETGTPLFRIV